MRIVHVITRRELRGAEVVAADLCESLARRGHETTLIGLYRPIEPTEESSLRPKDVELRDLNGWRKGTLDPFLFWRAARTLQKIKPDIVQANAFHALKFTALTKKVTGATWPLVYRNVGIASQWVKRRSQVRWGRRLLRNVDHILSVSEASRRDFRQTFGAAESRISISRQGVVIPERLGTVTVRERLARVIGRPARESFILHVGNFSYEKNHLGLIDAFEKLLGEIPASLILIGDGPLRSKVAEKVNRRNLQQHVHLLGARRDAGKLVAGADLLALSSLVEGIPGVVLEAAAQGVPVVGTNVGGMSEIVLDGKTGRLVSSGDMASLATAMKELLIDSNRRQQMGQAARQFVGQHHEMEATVDKIEALYRRLIEEKRSATRSGFGAAVVPSPNAVQTSRTAS